MPRQIRTAGALEALVSGEVGPSRELEPGLGTNAAPFEPLGAPREPFGTPREPFGNWTETLRRLYGNDRPRIINGGLGPLWMRRR